MLNCEICKIECNNYRVLSKHIIKIHNISSKEYYNNYLKKENEGICLNCGKFTNFFNLNKGYAKFCSYKCIHNSNKIKEKIKNTNLLKYGVEYPLQNKELQEKQKQTFLKKYNVEYPLQNKELQEKQKQTNLERYGVEHSLQNKELQEKQKQTFLKRYGVENPSQCKEIREKQKQTCLERYGVKTTFQSEDIKERIKNTNLLKYGVENPSQNKEIREKIKETNIQRYNSENPSQCKEIREKQKQTCLERYGVKTTFQSEEIQNKIKQTNLERYGIENYLQSDEYKELKRNEIIEKYKKEFPQLNIINYNNNDSIMTCYCNECNKNYDIGIMMLGSRLRHLKYKNPCTNCYPINGHYSNEEKELVDYIKSIYNGEIIENDRNILNRQELDVYLPNLKLAFEYNGLFWHSSEQKDKYYHYNKTIGCEKQGIKLIHIWEHEWKEKNSEIKKKILKIINKNFLFEEIKEPELKIINFNNKNYEIWI